MSTAPKPHGFKNYFEMTPEREAVAEVITTQAYKLCQLARAHGLVLTVERDGMPLYGMGNADVKIDVRVGRKVPE